MKWLTLTLIKQQIRMEEDFQDEDAWLEATGESVEDSILKVLGRSYDDLVEQYGKVPTPIVHAAKLLVAELYKNREVSSNQKQEPNLNSFDYLVKPFMKL